MMLIKYNLLERSLEQGFKPVYLIFGGDEFLMAEASHHIKKRYFATYECDFQSLQLQAEGDYKQWVEQANTYSLFHSHTLIEAYYNKKSLDKSFEKLLQHYLTSPNAQSLLIIKAPQLSLKSIEALAKHPELQAVQIIEMTSAAQQKWIEDTLVSKKIPDARNKATLIFQYTEGNLLASHQAIIKLELLPEDVLQQLDTEQLAAQLIDEREFENHQLVVNLLSGQRDKVIRSIQRSVRDRGESLLILWYLTQTIRQLIGLLAYQQGQSTTSPERLGIWQSRLGLYQKALLRLKEHTLHALLLLCNEIDIAIKTNYRDEEERLLEVALKLCSQSS